MHMTMTHSPSHILILRRTGKHHLHHYSRTRRPPPARVLSAFAPKSERGWNHCDACVTTATSDTRPSPLLDLSSDRVSTTRLAHTINTSHLNRSSPPTLALRPLFLMFRCPNAFNAPAYLSPTCSHPPSPLATMHQDAYTRFLTDRGTAAHIPSQDKLASFVANSDANANVNPNDTLHFASAPSDGALHSSSSPAFASASPDADDAERRFEREFADVEMDQCFNFDGPNSPLCMTASSPVHAPAIVPDNIASSPSHASPPPSSEVDGASPALSDSNSNFGFGSPLQASLSASTLQLPDTNTSPRSFLLYSPSYDCPVLASGPGLGFDGTFDGAHGMFPHEYDYEYSMDGSGPYSLSDANPCADPAGLGLGFTPHAESPLMPWETMDGHSAHPQPGIHQVPNVDVDVESHPSPTAQHHEESMQMQGQEDRFQEYQQEQQQLYVVPSESMCVPPRPRLSPLSSSAVAPQDLELPPPASGIAAPSTPAFFVRLWDSPTSSPTMLADHGRSTSETGVYGQHGHFVPPPSGPTAIPISNPRANYTGNDMGHLGLGQSFTQVFQSSSAPVQHQSGFGFMPSSELSPVSSGAVDNPFNDKFGSSQRSVPFGNGIKAGNGSGGGSSVCARARSYRRRVSSGLRDVRRAVFSTRAGSDFLQGQLQAHQQQRHEQGDAHARDKIKLKAEDDRVWTVNLGSNVKETQDMNEDDKATLRSPTSGSGLQEDTDATIRRRKRTSAQTPSPSLPAAVLASTSSSRSRSRGPSSEKDASSSRGSKEKESPSRSELRPPKLAQSAWQLFFAEWIQRRQFLHGSDRKLNVAQSAKEASLEYGKLSPEQLEPYKRRSQTLKEQRERDLAAWQRTLTPEDIKRENAYRAAQRKEGKSRKGNLKDPNAPKKPLSAYFMFLQHIRADPERVKKVFGDEKETTAQSVLAAQFWRSMTDEERKPFLAQAEKAKLAYEAARRLYEEGTVGIETTISFSNTDDASSATPGTPSTFPFLGTGEGTTFVIGRPAHEMGLSSDSEPEVDMDSDASITDDERLQSHILGRM